MAYNPSTNIVVSGKTFTDVPSVLFKTPDGSTVNFAHVGGQIRFSPTLEEQTQNVANYEDVIIDPITSTLLNQLDSDFIAENIKKDIDLFGLVGMLEAGGSSVKDFFFSTTSLSSNSRDLVIPWHNVPDVLIVIGPLICRSNSVVGLVINIKDADGGIYQEKWRYQSKEFLYGTSVTDGSLFTLSRYGDNAFQILLNSGETSYGEFFGGLNYRVFAAKIF